MIIATLLLSLFVTMALVPVLRRLAGRLRAVDLPDPRKVHVRPMPKTGGLAMAAGALLPLLLLAQPTPFLRALFCAAGIVVVFGFVDDLRDLGFRAKFAAQLAAALIIVFFGGVQIRNLGTLLPDGMLLPAALSVPLTVIVIVGVTNAINLADGLDGLAGGISLLSFLCLGVLAHQAGRGEIVLVAAAMGGAIFGFLRFNTHPATVFMGDAGSQLLGFLAATLALNLTQTTVAYSPLLPLVLLGLPVYDTLRVMVERIREGRPPFVADRRHLHHKLMEVGLSHPEAVLVIYLVQTLLVAAAYLLRFHSDWLLLGGYLLFCALALLTFRLAALRHNRSPRSVPAGGHPRWLPRREVIALFTLPALQFGVILVCLMLTLQPAQVPAWLGTGALALGGAALVLRWLWPALRGLVVRLAVCMVTPFLVYLGDFPDGSAAEVWSSPLNHILFGLLAVLVVVVVKYAPQEGFRSTPLDYLVLFIALAVPLFPAPGTIDPRLSLTAAKIIALFFSFEAWLAQRREHLWLPELTAGGMLIATGMRTVFQ